MKIELKRLEISKRKSQESVCFVADVWIDSKLRGTVSNDGHGGMSRFSPPSLADLIGMYARHIPEYASAPAMLAADFYVNMLVEDTL